jgi:hypothetical protein
MKITEYLAINYCCGVSTTNNKIYKYPITIPLKIKNSQVSIQSQKNEVQSLITLIINKIKKNYEH